MQERWTSDARWVMDEAAKVAAARTELLINSGHVLLALLDTPEERLPATLRLLGVPPEELRADLLSALALVTEPGAPPAAGREAAVRRMEELALREALHLGDAYVHSGHLLLALLREPGHLAGSLLLGYGVDREVAAKAVQEMFRKEVVQGRSREADEARVLHRLDELGRELGRLRKVLEPRPDGSLEVRPGGQVSYLIDEHDGQVLLVVTRIVLGQVETATRRFDSQQEAIRGLRAEVEVRPPDAMTALVNGEVQTLEELRAGAERAE